MVHYTLGLMLFDELRIGLWSCGCSGRWARETLVRISLIFKINKNTVFTLNWCFVIYDRWWPKYSSKLVKSKYLLCDIICFSVCCVSTICFCPSCWVWSNSLSQVDVNVQSTMEPGYWWQVQMHIGIIENQISCYPEALALTHSTYLH